MLAQDVLLENLCCIAVELEHAGVERQHILGRGVGRRRGGFAGDRRHIGRKGLGTGDGRARKHDCSNGQAGGNSHVAFLVALKLYGPSADEYLILGTSGQCADS